MCSSADLGGEREKVDWIDLVPRVPIPDNSNIARDFPVHSKRELKM